MIIQNQHVLHLRDFFNNVLPHLECLSDEYVVTINPLTAEFTDRGKIQPIPKKKNVLLGMWDEYDSKYHRQLLSKYDVVFNQYITGEEEQLYSNLFSLPLGYNGNIIEEQEHIQPILPTNERPVDLFFSGHMSSKQRYESMVDNIAFFKVNETFRRHVLDFNITTGFMRGFKGKEYYKRLYNSKIVFCPPGNISNETYRMYEAMMCGCVVVCPTMPTTTIYEDIPVIQVDNFKTEGARVACELLDNQDRLVELQQKSINYWNNHFSYSKVANYILERIV